MNDDIKVLKLCLENYDNEIPTADMDIQRAVSLYYFYRIKALCFNRSIFNIIPSILDHLIDVVTNNKLGNFYILHNNKVIGIVTCSFKIVNSRLFVEISNFSVIPRKRGSGLGKKSLAIVLKMLKDIGVTDVILSVSSNNKPAIGVYKSNGFIK